ncbi:hypothetical protein EJP69_26495 [Variovorax gossypii]|uniref:Uncharacterized protein n=1 Tax=Variovorax gossypii TaxID=1679495 RepID=A0A3S0HAM1_9BURK|nr:hypothetical protein [Variovorax gossypii]RTQ31074.1 hypothetical protein EJP69_26495 [Variovorax gossypii]
MTPQQIVGLASRLFAIWMGVSAIQAVSIALALKAGTNNPDAVWVPYIIGGLYLLVGLLCWFFPMAIAHRLIPRTRFDDALQLPARQAMVVACVALGLLVIAFKAVGPVLGYLSICVLWIANGQTLWTLDAIRHIDGWIGIGQLALGVLLVGKAHAVSARLLPLEAKPHAALADTD